MQPLLHPLARADQRRTVDELERNSGTCTVIVAGEELLLHLRCGGVVPHAHGELVVEVLVTAAHAADVERAIGAQRIRTRGRIVTEDDRHRGDDVEPLQGLADLGSTGGDVGELVAGVLRREEDRQPAVRDLARELEVLRTDGREVDRDGVTHGVHGEYERLARAVGQRQGEELAVVLHFAA